MIQRYDDDDAQREESLSYCYTGIQTAFEFFSLWKPKVLSCFCSTPKPTYSLSLTFLLQTSFKYISFLHFLLSLASFEGNLKSKRKLIMLAIEPYLKFLGYIFACCSHHKHTRNSQTDRQPNSYPITYCHALSRHRLDSILNSMIFIIFAECKSTLHQKIYNALHVFIHFDLIFLSSPPRWMFFSMMENCWMRNSHQCWECFRSFRLSIDRICSNTCWQRTLHVLELKFT